MENKSAIKSYVKHTNSLKLARDWIRPNSCIVYQPKVCKLDSGRVFYSVSTGNYAIIE